jgi:curved DNA-binding protein CbpA
MAAKDLYEKDFYKILGVGKSANGDEIKKKYRSLARELHPDKTKGDAALEEKFKAVSEAYDILSDGKKRAEYDQARDMFERGGMRAPQGGQNFQGGDFSDIFGGGNPQDIFANLFGGGGRRGPRKGQDLQTEATITFKEAAFGTTLELRLSADGGPSQTISARVPAGVNDGAKIRVKGKGSKGEAGPGVNRRKRGQRNEHRYLDTFIITNGTYNLKNRMVDPDFKVYEGLVAFVGNYDWKAVWVEYGTLAMRGRYILVNAAERVAKQYGAEFEIMYAPVRMVNRKELGRRISKGLLKNRVNKRAAEYRTGSKG